MRPSIMIVEGELAGRPAPILPAAAGATDTQTLSPDLESLIAALISHKVSEEKARQLVQAKPETVRLQLRAIPYLPDGQGKKNFAGRLVKAIENDYELPQALVDVLERERREKGMKGRSEKSKDCPYCRGFSGWRYVNGFGGPVF